MTAEAAWPHDRAPTVTELVMAAKNNDQRAWNGLVERYAPLVWSICRNHGLSVEDAADISQTIWLRLVEQLDALRDPAAFPGWLSTTTRRECCRFRRTAPRAHALGGVPDIENVPDTQAGGAEQELFAAERRAALREAFADLPPGCQRLIAVLLEDPPVSYSAISSRLGIAVGSIGPIRGRCLEKLRRHPAVAALIQADRV